MRIAWCEQLDGGFFHDLGHSDTILKWENHSDSDPAPSKPATKAAQIRDADVTRL